MSERRKPRLSGVGISHLSSPSISSSSRMILRNHPFLITTFLALIVFIFLLFSFSNALLSFLSDTPLNSYPSLQISPNSQPPKLYIYDLPKKFTYGVIESYASARQNAESKYPGHQHSAEWWLFADLINGSRKSPVIRVFDPEEAELFYVPFFSSLSLVVNPVRSTAIVSESPSYSDEEMQDELIRWLQAQRYWRRNKGRDHVFVCQDPNALYRVIDSVKNGVLLVSDFGRLRGDQASLVKDVILPYSHRINTFIGDVGVEHRNALLFFMGNRYRKEGGKIRDLLFQVLENEKDVVIKHGTQSRESRRMATHEMHSSKFCLHPAGDTPSACRLFDAILSLCVPVIISDDIELPFEDVIDYTEIAIFVDSASAVRKGFLTKFLRHVSAERIVEYQEGMKKVRPYMEYEHPNGATVTEIWRQVSLKLPFIKLMINREKRLLKNGFTQPNCACLCSNNTASTHSL